ncbi:MAG: hypothetical protein J0L75_09485 [Spirochaetes bacterium]|nr:hypothetical protein [Spirochaetota bacterium]
MWSRNAKAARPAWGRFLAFAVACASLSVSGLPAAGIPPPIPGPVLESRRFAYLARYRPDGKALAWLTVSVQGYLLSRMEWDARGRATLATAVTGLPQETEPSALVWHGDAWWILGLDGRLEGWNDRGMKRVFSLTNRVGASSLAHRGDRLLIGFVDGSLLEIDGRSSLPLRRLDACGARLTALQAEGDSLFVGSWDRSVRRLDLDTWEPRGRWDFPGRVECLEVRGSLLVAGLSAEALLRDEAMHEEDRSRKLPPPVASNTFALIRLPDGEPVLGPAFRRGISSVRIHPEENLILAASWDFTLVASDPQARIRFRYNPLGAIVRDLAIAPGGDSFAVAGWHPVGTWRPTVRLYRFRKSP